MAVVSSAATGNSCMIRFPVPQLRAPEGSGACGAGWGPWEPALCLLWGLAVGCDPPALSWSSQPPLWTPSASAGCHRVVLAPRGLHLAQRSCPLPSLVNAGWQSLGRLPLPPPPQGCSGTLPAPHSRAPTKAALVLAGAYPPQRSVCTLSLWPLFLNSPPPLLQVTRMKTLRLWVLRIFHTSYVHSRGRGGWERPGSPSRRRRGWSSDHRGARPAEDLRYPAQHPGRPF